MKEDLILVTSEPPKILDALEVTDLYGHRWQVEIFFRWLILDVSGVSSAT